MAKRLRITDYVQVTKANVSHGVELKDSVGNPGLLVVRIAATHAGIITGNNTFYLPDKMRKGTATWTAQYNKPVLTHHNSDSDAIGRIVSASYIDLMPTTVGQFRNKLCKDSHLVEDSMTRFMKGQLSSKAEIQFVRDVLMPSGVLSDKDYQGMGYSEIVAAITSPEAIQKIKDGRYLTGSVSASTDAAVCSVCEADWLQDGKCEHDPGTMYDGGKAFLIAGDFEYEEYSFVNNPADAHSRALEIVSDKKSDIFISVPGKEKTQVADQVEQTTQVAVEGTAITEGASTVATEALVADAPVTAETAAAVADAAPATPEMVQPKIDEAPAVEPAVEAAATEAAAPVEDKLKVLREEIKYLYDTLHETEDRLVKVTGELRDLRAQRVLDFKQLSGTEIKDVVAEKAELLKLDDKQLNTQAESVDMSRIADRLNSGLTNSSPTGAISNPSAIIDTAPVTPDPASEEMRTRVTKTAQYLEDTVGLVARQKYEERMRREGFLG